MQPSAIDTKGIPALRQLLAVAPPPDAPVIFLPQQRSVFLLQALQRWVSSDEYIPTELKAGIAELFSHLAPIVQDLSGSHWDLMFDQIESNLDAADWEEPYTLPAVYDSCRLLAQIKDLAASNADLRETAKARVDASQELVLALFLARPSMSLLGTGFVGSELTMCPQRRRSATSHDCWSSRQWRGSSRTSRPNCFRWTSRSVRCV